MACKKQFLENANRETRIKLRVPNALTGEETTEWAYTPYLDYSATESGPMVNHLFLHTSYVSIKPLTLGSKTRPCQS